MGVIGSRVTGGGFGGCTVSLVKTDRIDEFVDSIGREYKTQTGIQATAFATRPAAGARIILP
jgi:galactokinase